MSLLGECGGVAYSGDMQPKSDRSASLDSICDPVEFCSNIRSEFTSETFHECYPNLFDIHRHLAEFVSVSGILSEISNCLRTPTEQFDVLNYAVSVFVIAV